MTSSKSKKKNPMDVLPGGMTGRAGAALAMKRQIEQMEMDNADGLLTAEEQSRLALMRDELQRLQAGKKK